MKRSWLCVAGWPRKPSVRPHSYCSPMIHSRIRSGRSGSNEIVTPGLSFKNRTSTPGRWLVANPGRQAIRICPRFRSVRSRRKSSRWSRFSSMRRTSASKYRESLVGSRPPRLRVKSSKPTDAEKSDSNRLTAGCETSSLSAAFVTLPVSETARNASSCRSLNFNGLVF